MKLTNKAKSALATAGYSVDPGLAISQLAAFAAQNSGIIPRNYFDPYDLRVGRARVYQEGKQAYAQDCRSISKDWTRFKAALIEAAKEVVTDTDVIKESASGRLSWQHVDMNKAGNPDGEMEWEYCAGQDYSTEYRRACVVLLEAAIHLVRRSRPAQSKQITCMAELRELNKQNGGCWFEPDTMRFFLCKIETDIIQGKYFISSERNIGSRKYTIRSFDETGSIDTVGEFCQYPSKVEAMKALKAMGQGVAA